MNDRITIKGQEYELVPVPPAPPAEPGIAKGTRWQNNASGRILLGECADVPASFRSNHTPLIPLPIGTIVFKPKIEGGKAAVRRCQPGEWWAGQDGCYCPCVGSPTTLTYPIFTRHVVQPDGTLGDA